MIQKHIYEAPEAEMLEVRFEERFLTDSPGVSTTGLPSYNGDQVVDQSNSWN